MAVNALAVEGDPFTQYEMFKVMFGGQAAFAFGGVIHLDYRRVISGQAHVFLWPDLTVTVEVQHNRVAVDDLEDDTGWYGRFKNTNYGPVRNNIPRATRIAAVM